jgi:hypothetical protein
LSDDTEPGPTDLSQQPDDPPSAAAGAELADGSVVFTGYLSDASSQPGDGDEDEEDWEDKVDDTPAAGPSSSPTVDPRFPIHAPPPPKRHKLEVPASEMRARAKEKHCQNCVLALKAIEKLIASKRDVFAAGANGLQAFRARAIQSCLHMAVSNNRRLSDAAARAAESQGFAEAWGGRMVRQWVSVWIKLRKLPTSNCGNHAKVWSVLNDPGVRTELRSYLCTNKWSMNLQKLSAFTKNELLPAEADKYLKHIVSTEMPQGLKKYIEIELFPCIQCKVSKGISLSTA